MSIEVTQVIGECPTCKEDGWPIDPPPKIVCSLVKDGSLKGMHIVGCTNTLCEHRLSIRHSPCTCDKSCLSIGHKPKSGELCCFKRTGARKHLDKWHKTKIPNEIVCQPVSQPTALASSVTDGVTLVDSDQPDDGFGFMDFNDDDPIATTTQPNNVVAPAASNTFNVVPQLYSFASAQLRKYSSWICAKVQHPYLDAISKIFVRSSRSMECAEEMTFSSKLANGTLQVYLCVARIVYGSAQAERGYLATLLSLVMPNGLFQKDRNRELPVPSTIESFRSKFHNQSAKDSLINLLPIPSCKLAEDDGHAYVGLLESVSHSFLSCGPGKNYVVHDRLIDVVNGPHYKSSIQHLVAPMALLGIPFVHCYVLIWGDGWDPFTSKSNRKPIWTLTGNVIFVDVLGGHVPYYHRTLLLSCGPGKANHDKVYQLLADDVSDCTDHATGKRKLFKVHSKHHNTDVMFSISMGFHLADQPERRDSVGLQAGNSNYHRMFGMACNYLALDKQFPSCDDCQVHNRLCLQRRNFNRNPDRPGCQMCYGWSVDFVSQHGCHKDKVFHQKLLPGEHGYNLLSGPSLLTFRDIKLGMELAHSKYAVEGLWNETDVRDYLNLFCLSGFRVELFVKNARNVAALREAQKPEPDSNLTIAEAKMILEDFEQHPDEYVVPQPSPITQIGDIDDRLEASMHTMMGLVKASFRLVMHWAGSRNKKKPMLNRLNVLMSDVKDLRLSFLNVILLKDHKFGGYVAENYSALFQLGPWLFSVLLEPFITGKAKAATPVPDVATLPQEKWKMKHNDAWLIENGYPKNSGRLLAADLTELVRLLMNDEEVPESLMPGGKNKAASKIPPAEIRAFVLSIHNMCCLHACSPQICLANKHQTDSQHLPRIF